MLTIRSLYFTLLYFPIGYSVYKRIHITGIVLFETLLETPLETTNRGATSVVMHDQHPTEEDGKEPSKQKMITHLNDSKLTAAYQSIYSKLPR
jgi:hypothetical protein